MTRSRSCDPVMTRCREREGLPGHGSHTVGVTRCDPLAVYLGCALIAVWCVLRAWDHLHGRPIEPDPWAELPQPV